MAACVNGIIGYEPPLVRKDAPMRPGSEPLLFPGVRGYAVEHEGRIHIPIVIAEREGAGDVGRFIDSLSPRCVFPCVISGRLEHMLVRRGWRRTFEKMQGEPVDVWVHPEAKV